MYEALGIIEKYDEPVTALDVVFERRQQGFVAAEQLAFVGQRAGGFSCSSILRRTRVA